MIGNPRVETLRSVATGLREQADSLDRIADILSNGWSNAGIAITRLMDHACRCQASEVEGFTVIEPDCPIHKINGFKSLLDSRNGDLDQEQVRRILHAIGRPRKQRPRANCICRKHGHNPKRNPYDGCNSPKHGTAKA